MKSTNASNFRRTFALRVVLLTATLALVLYLAGGTRFYMTAALAAVAVAYQVASLIALVENTNRVTDRFLSSVAASDYSGNFTTGLSGRTFDELNHRLRELMARFRDINLEKEATSRYLRMIVRHVEVGLIAFDDGGRVELINAAARRFLGVGADHLSALRERDPELAGRLGGLRPGRRELVKLRRDDGVLQLSLRATELQLLGRKITLVSLQDIAGELDEKEMEAWQNLIRVFTHEIKNSLTPIASLATTVEELLLDAGGEPRTLSAEHRDDVREALRTIRQRSRGLLVFLDAYRDLTHVPQPELATVPVGELVGSAQQLVADRLRRGTVGLQIEVEPETLRVTADPRLIEQVLLNLLLNAAQALEGRPDGRIAVVAHRDRRSRVVIRVTDNGPGILPEVQEKVFVPFFSTRRDGSGIGLCLSRQIMRKHRGELTVRSIPELQTSFTVRF